MPGVLRAAVGEAHPLTGQHGASMSMDAEVDPSDAEWGRRPQRRSSGCGISKLCVLPHVQASDAPLHNSLQPGHVPVGLSCPGAAGGVRPGSRRVNPLCRWRVCWRACDCRGLGETAGRAAVVYLSPPVCTNAERKKSRELCFQHWG